MLPLAACGDSNEDSTGETNDDQENVEEVGEENEITEEENDQENINRETVVDGVNYADIKLSPEDAYNKFMDAHADAKITEIKLDTEDEYLAYKVEGYNEKNELEMRIDAVSEEVKKEETDELDEEDKEDKEDKVITDTDISKVADLIDKGMNKADSDLKFKKWSLEESDGILEFEIEFGDNKEDIEYSYDLDSGELLEIDD